MSDPIYLIHWSHNSIHAEIGPNGSPFSAPQRNKSNCLYTNPRLRTDQATNHTFVQISKICAPRRPKITPFVHKFKICAPIRPKLTRFVQKSKICAPTRQKITLFATIQDLRTHNAKKHICCTQIQDVHSKNAIIYEPISV